MTIERWATFDCYGTLVDGLGGMRAALQGLAPDDAERLLRAYCELEPAVQGEHFRATATCSPRRFVGPPAASVALSPEGEHVAATDVTGYGLLGHAGEMVLGAGLGAVIRRGSVPVWDRAQELASEGCYAAGLAANREHRGADVVADGVRAEELLPLYDPQTSGGLLIAVGAGRVDALVSELEARGEVAAVVGEVTEERVLRVTP